MVNFLPHQETHVAATATENNPQQVAPADQVVIDMFDSALAKTKTYYSENKNLFSGVCEQLENPNSLNVTLLLLVKQQGATDVYCSSSDQEFMAEALLPSGAGYYCIDESSVAAVYQQSSKNTNNCGN